MRTIMLLVLLTVLIGVPWSARAQETEPTLVSCTIPFNYAEAVDENEFVLLKLQTMLITEPSPLDTPRVAGIYLQNLQSMRRYHERVAPNLPGCAREFNRRFVATLTAAQDVLSLYLAQAAIPDQQASYARKAQGAQQRFADAGADLFEHAQSIAFDINTE